MYYPNIRINMYFLRGPGIVHFSVYWDSTLSVYGIVYNGWNIGRVSTRNGIWGGVYNGWNMGRCLQQMGDYERSTRNGIWGGFTTDGIWERTYSGWNIGDLLSPSGRMVDNV
jgi:hypothetical protein